MYTAPFKVFKVTLQAKKTKTKRALGVQIHSPQLTPFHNVKRGKKSLFLFIQICSKNMKSGKVFFGVLLLTDEW